MNKLLALVVFALLSSVAVSATPQQAQMKACNADAAKQELKGDARKKFMSDCLSAKKEDHGKKKELTAQQLKMKDCNAEAKTKGFKGDARKKFMRECLSK